MSPRVCVPSTVALVVVVATTALAAHGVSSKRATYRGVNPQADLSASALQGLRAEGLDVTSRGTVNYA